MPAMAPLLTAGPFGGVQSRSAMFSLEESNLVEQAGTLSRRAGDVTSVGDGRRERFGRGFILVEC